MTINRYKHMLVIYLLSIVRSSRGGDGSMLVVKYFNRCQFHQHFTRILHRYFGAKNNEAET